MIETGNLDSCADNELPSWPDSVADRGVHSTGATISQILDSTHDTRSTAKF